MLWMITLWFLVYAWLMFLLIVSLNSWNFSVTSFWSPWFHNWPDSLTYPHQSGKQLTSESRNWDVSLHSKVLHHLADDKSFELLSVPCMHLRGFDASINWIMAVVKQRRMLAFILELLIVCSGLFVTDWALSAQDYLGIPALNEVKPPTLLCQDVLPWGLARYRWGDGWPQLQKV